MRDPADLVAALPVLLGFHPTHSLVLVATGGESGRRLGLTVRVDLPPPEHAAAVVESAVSGVLLDAPTGAAVIVVGAPRGADPPGREVVELVTGRLARHGVDVHTAVWADGTAAGSRWSCYQDCGCTGTLPDPATTPLAAAAVAVGQVVLRDRGELEALVRPTDQACLRRREELLDQALDAALDRPDPAGALDTVAGCRLVEAALEAAAAGHLELDDVAVVDLAMALTTLAVRDTALRWCAGPDGAAAEQLWAAMARETPDPEAAEPAALLAVSALLRGDGALANVALDRAAAAWPGHRLTAILRSAADVGIRPEQVREWLRPEASGPGCGRLTPTGPPA